MFHTIFLCVMTTYLTSEQARWWMLFQSIAAVQLSYMCTSSWVKMVVTVFRSWHLLEQMTTWLFVMSYLNIYTAM